MHLIPKEESNPVHNLHNLQDNSQWVVCPAQHTIRMYQFLIRFLFKALPQIKPDFFMVHQESLDQLALSDVFPFFCKEPHHYDLNDYVVSDMLLPRSLNQYFSAKLSQNSSVFPFPFPFSLFQLPYSYHHIS